jgi:hypothetical protein
MSNENTTATAPAATFGEFFVNHDREADNIGSFHCAMSDHGLAFPRSVSELMEALSFGTSDDEEVQNNVAVFAGLLLELGGYMLAALEQYPAERETA